MDERERFLHSPKKPIESMTYPKRTRSSRIPRGYPQVIHNPTSLQSYPQDIHRLLTGSDRSKDLPKDLTDLLVVNQTIVRLKGTKTVSHIVI